MKPLQCTLTWAILAASAAQAISQAPQSGWWSTWRGSDGTGVAAQGNPPTEWSETKNIRWKVAIPGLGISSPIIWKDRIYVTTAIETKEEGTPAAKPPPPRRRGRRGRRSAPPTKFHEFVVVCLNRQDGKVVWRTTVKKTVPHEAGHRTSSLASGSPITDGDHIYAFFGSRGIHCLDMAGKIKWSKDLGLMKTRNQFGEGSSPALHGNSIVVNWDHEGESFIVSLDKRDGKELWRRPRKEITTWSTPVIVTVAGRPQVITTGTGASRAYDLESGDLLWQCSGMTTNCIPTPMHADGVAYLMSGFRGACLQAVELSGAKGDLSGKKSIKWMHERGTSYTPSGLLYNGFLYFFRGNSGSISCLDAATGKVHYEGQRLKGMKSVYSSPVGAGGRVYTTSRKGTTKVIALGAKFEELATNTLDDGFDASAAIAGDELYLRGRKHLYCISEKK